MLPAQGDQQVLANRFKKDKIVVISRSQGTGLDFFPERPNMNRKNTI